MGVPPLDDDARRRASRSAIDARRARAEWKARLSRGEVDLAGLLEAATQDPAVAGMRVTEALGALPGVGPKGVATILANCGIASSRRLRGLGTKQRAALVAVRWGRHPTA